MAYNYTREVAKTRRWAEREEKRRLRERDQELDRERRNRRGSGDVGRVTEAIISSAITVAGAYGEPQQSSTETVNNWGESHQETRSADRSREISGGTRNQGNRTGGSGRRR
jgi:hypothetical protein